MSTEDHLKELFEQALAGEAPAYRRFLDDLSRHLRAFFRKRMQRMPDSVEDLVQETLLAIHNQRHTYDPGQPLTAWIHAIARYKFVDMLRLHARHDALNEPFDEAHDLFAAEESEAAQARRDLGKLLDDLPERQRVPIVHMKIEGLSVIETARLTGMSESAVKVAVHRGLKALALRLRGTT